jgi:hypothetical protein
VGSPRHGATCAGSVPGPVEGGITPSRESLAETPGDSTMARATTPKGPKPHPTKRTPVFTTKLRRFNTLQEAEAELEPAGCGTRRRYV